MLRESVITTAGFLLCSHLHLGTNLTIPCQGLELSTMDYIAKLSHSEFTSSYTCKRFDTRWVRERFSDHTTAANPYWTPLARLIT